MEFTEDDLREAKRQIDSCAHPCGLSCGLGVSGPSPQAPPRQIGSAFLPDLDPATFEKVDETFKQ